MLIHTFFGKVTFVLYVRLFIFLSLAFVFGESFQFVETPVELLLVVLAATAFFIVSIPVFIIKNYSLFEPLSVLIILVFVGVLLKTAYVLNALPTDMIVRIRLLSGNDPATILIGSIAINVGLLAFVLGYMTQLPRVRLTRFWIFRNDSWHIKRTWFLILFLMFLSLASLLSFIAVTGIQIQTIADLSAKRFGGLEGGFSGRIYTAEYYLYRLANLGRFAFYLILVLTVQGKARLWSIQGLLLLIAGAISLFIPVFFNNRAGIVLILADALILVSLLRRRLPKLMILGSILIAVLLFAFSSSLRSGDSFSLGKIYDDILGQKHFMDVTKTALIIRELPEAIGFLQGETLYSWLLSPIPRSIWPNKPLSIELSEYISDIIYGIRESSVPPGIIGELFLNFGWFGIIIGMLLLGLLFKNSYQSMVRHFSNPNVSLVFTFFLTRFVAFVLNDSFGIGVLKLGTDLVPLMFILLFITKRYRQPVAVAAQYRLVSSRGVHTLKTQINGYISVPTSR